MFKRSPYLSVSVPLSQFLLGISCLLTTSAIADPILTTSTQELANSPQVTNPLASEVPNSITRDRSVDPRFNLKESLEAIPVAKNPHLPCPTSTSTNDSTKLQPLPVRKGEITDINIPPISCVAHLTSVPTSLESLKIDKTEWNLTTPASSSPIVQATDQDVTPKTSPDQLSGDTVSPVDDSKIWHFKFQPYLTAPFSTYGTNTIGNRSADYNLSLGEVLNAIDFIIYGRFEAWNNNLGFIADASYTKLGGVASATRRLTTLSTSTSFSQGIYDFAVSYHFGDPAQFSLPSNPSNKSFPLYWFEPILGVRLNSIDVSIDASLDFGRFDQNFQRTVSAGRTWLEPLIGAKLGMQVSDPIILWLRGDVSGFGLAGNPDLSWNVIAGADWWISPTTSLQIAYRFYEISYGNNDVIFESGYNGPYLGVTFNF